MADVAGAIEQEAVCSVQNRTRLVINFLISLKISGIEFPAGVYPIYSHLLFPLSFRHVLCIQG